MHLRGRSNTLEICVVRQVDLYWTTCLNMSSKLFWVGMVAQTMKPISTPSQVMYNQS